MILNVPKKNEEKNHMWIDRPRANMKKIIQTTMSNPERKNKKKNEIWSPHLFSLLSLPEIHGLTSINLTIGLTLWLFDPKKKS